MAAKASLIGVIVNVGKDVDLSVAHAFARAVRERGGEVAMSRGDGHADKPELARCDAWVCVGGDGTIIRASKAAAAAGVPLLGMNLGTLGYLAEVEPADADWLAGRLMRGEYRVEERMLLHMAYAPASPVQGEAAVPSTPAQGEAITPAAPAQGEMTNTSASAQGEATAPASLTQGEATAPVSLTQGEATDPPPIVGWDASSHLSGGDSWDGRSLIALNEVVVSRGSAPHVVSLKLYVNSTLIDVYAGDGILVSTPTGSTAYAFSAGGPIVDPELELFSIVPICPHMILPKPVLVEPGKTITIVPHRAGRGVSASVAVDGVAMPDLCHGQALVIRRATRPVRMARFAEDSFYTVLKRKLYNRERL